MLFCKGESSSRIVANQWKMQATCRSEGRRSTCLGMRSQLSQLVRQLQELQRLDAAIADARQSRGATAAPPSALLSWLASQSEAGRTPRGYLAAPAASTPPAGSTRSGCFPHKRLCNTSTGNQLPPPSEQLLLE